MIGRRKPPVTGEDRSPKGFDSFDLRLGDVMRGERATLGKSLLDVQRELKIKATYISAIENADPTGFETPGFVAGYVRSYARYLGLDPEWAYQQFCEEGQFATVHGMAPAASGPKPVKKKVASTGMGADPLSNPNASFVPQKQAVLSQVEPGAVGSLLVLVALIGALGFGGWSVLQEIQKVRFAPVEQAPQVMVQLDPLAGASLPPVEGPELATALPAPDQLDRLYRPQMLDVPVLEARDGPIATLRPESVGVLAGSVAPLRKDTALAANSPETAPAAVQVLEAAAPDLVVFALRPSWVRVRSADGSVLFEKILDAGESYILPQTEEPPLLRAGNAGSVFFAVNGQTFGPAADGAQVVKGVVLSADAVRESYQSADLTQDQALATMVADLRAQWADPAPE